MSKQEILIALAKDILPESILKKVESEDFDHEATILEYQNHNKELLLNSLDKSEIPESIINTLSSEIKSTLVDDINAKAFGQAEQKIRKFGIRTEAAKKFTKEGEDVKLDHWLKALEEHVTSSSTGNQAEWQEKLNLATGENLELVKQLELVKSEKETEIQNIRQEFEQKEFNKNLAIGFKGKVQELRGTKDEESVWSTHLNNRAVEAVLKTEIKASGYKETFDGEKYVITNEDGTKITDGKNFLTTDDVLKNLGKKAGILKVANGGSTNGEEVKPSEATEGVVISPELQKVLDKRRPVGSGTA